MPWRSRGWPGSSKPVGDFIDVIVDDPGAVVYPVYVQMNYTLSDLYLADANEYNHLFGIAYYNTTSGMWQACRNTGVNTSDFDGFEGYAWAYLEEGELSPKVIMTRVTPIGGIMLPIHALDMITPYISTMVLLLLLCVALALSRRKKTS